MNKVRGMIPAILNNQFPGGEGEFKFHPSRKWRFDWAWKDKKVAFEYEGGIFTNGAHTRGAHYDSDCEKYSTAAILGWTVIRATPVMWRDGRALQLLRMALNR